MGYYNDIDGVCESSITGLFSWGTIKEDDGSIVHSPTFPDLWEEASYYSDNGSHTVLVMKFSTPDFKGKSIEIEPAYPYKMASNDIEFRWAICDSISNWKDYATAYDKNFEDSHRLAEGTVTMEKSYYIPGGGWWLDFNILLDTFEKNKDYYLFFWKRRNDEEHFLSSDMAKIKFNLYSGDYEEKGSYLKWAYGGVFGSADRPSYPSFSVGIDIGNTHNWVLIYDLIIPSVPGVITKIKAEVPGNIGENISCYYALCTTDENWKIYAKANGLDIEDACRIAEGNFLSPSGGTPSLFTFTVPRLTKGDHYYLHIWARPTLGDKNILRLKRPMRIYYQYEGGVCHIDNGSKIEEYLCNIDDGSSYAVYMPYIDNGTTWDVYG